MPSDQFERDLLHLLAQCAKALEQIALNTRPVPAGQQQLQGEPIKWSAVMNPEEKPPVPVRAIKPEVTPDMPPW